MIWFRDDLLLKILFVSFTLVPSTKPLLFSSILNSVFWIRIDIGRLDRDALGFRLPDRILEDKKNPPKNEEFSCFEVLDLLF
jgi:hypothetical protein